MEEGTLLRIGELSKRSGVSPELLRAWERRYDLLHPVRSSGGLRLYSPADVDRVRLMRRHLADGLAAAEAAALTSRGARDAEPHAPALPVAALRDELADALDRFDEPRAQAVLDRLQAAATVDTLVSDVMLPYLRALGERWARGDASIAHEHFASSVLHGRLLALARGWGSGVAPLALLACLPGEQHELGLLAFGLALRARGWRIGYLGADTPLDTLDRAARALDPHRRARSPRRARPPQAREALSAGARRRRRSGRARARPRGRAERRSGRRGRTGHHVVARHPAASTTSSRRPATSRSRSPAR
jgi:DNA-binding transcriptional MerR regulator